jgi:hypothetical protein
VIYINNNMPAPAFASGPIGPIANSSAPPPAEIHHHHYTAPAEAPRITFRIPAAPSHSALGMASLALGIISCVVCWVPWLGLIAVPVGAIGALLGVLGVLVSLLFRKSSAGLPLAGIFICCLAGGISIASTRTLPYWRGQLDRVISNVLPAGWNLPRSAAPSPAPPPPPLPATISKALSNPIGAAGNLFDSSSAPATPAAPATGKPAGAPSTPSKATIAPKLSPAIAAARDQLIAAEKACDRRTMQTPEYQAAVKSAADARSIEMQLRQNAPAGSADLIQAGKDMIKADNAVTDTLSRAQLSDPAVVAARQALAAAHAAAAQN